MPSQQHWGLAFPRKCLVAPLSFLLTAGLLLACIPVSMSHSLASPRDDEILTIVRRAYIVQRRADGKSDVQITDEIRVIDREWEINLVLSKGDLFASTRPGQLNTQNCRAGSKRGELGPRRRCEAEQKAQRQLLDAAGIELD